MYHPGMCGRYALILPPEAVRGFFGHAERPNFPPRYNIAPTQPVPVVRALDGVRRFDLMRWGFIPGWVKNLKDFPLVINVRSETAREKPSFRAAFTRRRCLMPADGFYEWHRVGAENRPYLFRRPDRSPFAFAALWETWHSIDGSEIDTVALLNTHANGLMSAIHHRCPVILEPSLFDRWLDPATGVDDAFSMLQPPPDDLLEMLRITPLVNKVSHDGPAVQQAWRDAEEPRSSSDTPSRPVRTRSRGGTTGSGQGSLF
jgi:putative SOS response-associated peptidase YedK